MANITRYISKQIEEAMADTPVICILGPRQVGKSTLAREIDPSRKYITFDDEQLLSLAKTDPTGFMSGLPEEVTLDEIQRAPELMMAIKFSVDKNRKPGRFILTGSANLMLLDNVNESLAGRMEIIYLNPLSEQEKKGGNESLLKSLINGDIKPNIGNSDVVEGVPDAVIQGGYPEPCGRPSNRAKQWFKQYLQAVIQKDVQDISKIRDGDELLKLLKIFSERTGNILNVQGLTKDLGLSRPTVESYISLLEKLFLIRRLKPWHSNKSKRLIKSPKVHILDTGLGASLSGLSEDEWNHPKTNFGGMLESFVVQQIICQSGWIDNDLEFSHYRDKDQFEVDLVIEKGRKVWGVEIKKSATVQSKDGAGLRKLEEITGDDWQGGILLYTGTHILPLKDVKNGFAVPMDRLWT